MAEAESVNEMNELVHQMQMMAANIMASDIADKAAAVRSLMDEFATRAGEMETKQAAKKTEDGVQYPAGDYAFVPDPESPSTWKLRLSEAGSPGKITVAQLGRAAAALSPAGFMGQQVELPADAVAAVKRRIRAEYRKLGVETGDMPASVKELSFFEQVASAVKAVLGLEDKDKAAQSQSTGLMVWKESDGTWRWIARYSNNLRDDDNPPEILSAGSHRAFVKAVDAGVFPLPELWLWHQPEWRWGKALWVATDEDDRGVVWALAGGVVSKGSEWLAELLSEKEPGEVRVSHGMPVSSIERDQKDRTVLTRHATVEISPLPAWAAANKWTTFHADGGGDMAIDAEKRKALIGQWGVSEEQLSALESANAEDATKALSEEIELKEGEGEAVAQEAAQEATKEPAAEDPAYVTHAEFVEAITPVVEAVNAVNAALGELSGEIKALKENRSGDIADAAQKAAEAALTPAASLAELIRNSIVGHAEARVKATDPAKVREGAPQETEPPASNKAIGIPFVDAMLNGKDWRDGLPNNQREEE